MRFAFLIAFLDPVVAGTADFLFIYICLNLCTGTPVWAPARYTPALSSNQIKL